jgi:hypothetical protein
VSTEVGVEADGRRGSTIVTDTVISTTPPLRLAFTKLYVTRSPFR